MSCISILIFEGQRPIGFYFRLHHYRFWRSGISHDSIDAAKKDSLGDGMCNPILNLPHQHDFFITNFSLKTPDLIAILPPFTPTHHNNFFTIANILPRNLVTSSPVIPSHSQNLTTPNTLPHFPPIPFSNFPQYSSIR